MHPAIESKYIQLSKEQIHYLVAGKGEPILLIHGFPTSSYLWRNIVSNLSDHYQVIAIDLPGFGKSDKLPEESYSFRHYGRVLTEFLDQLQLEHITLGVHDLGGPIGLYWMVNNMTRVKRLILFNTLVYPKFSWAVKLFALSTVVPVVKDWLTSPSGIKKTMYFGVHQKNNLTEDIIVNYQSPFADKQSRKVLLKSIQRLSLKGFAEIEEKLPLFKGPVQIIYGERDKILPKVGNTMKKVKEDLPQSKVNSLPNCGHFLQEDAPSQISEVVLAFMQQE